jgi:hypothetical protein
MCSAMRLPDENELRNVIRQRMEPELSLAAEILALGTGVFTSGRRITPAEGIDVFVVRVGLGLLYKACRQYRAIGSMVELSLGDVVETNSRMMFETMLASHFVLRAEVKLTCRGVSVPEVPGKPLTPRFRTSLYRANDAINGPRFVQGLQETQGSAGQTPVKTPALIEKDAAERKTEVGEEWTKRIRKARNYSGVSGASRREPQL